MIVLNFWGSWCSVCQQEAPALSVAARQFKPSGVQFVGVDVADNSASAKAYMQQYGLLYPSLSDPGDLIAAEFDRLVPISAFPSTLVISPDGRIAGRVIGAASVQDLRRLIKALSPFFLVGAESLVSGRRVQGRRSRSRAKACKAALDAVAARWLGVRRPGPPKAGDCR